MVTLLFVRFYSKSLTRPWIKSADAARSDATYRMSVLITGPFMVVIATALLIMKYSHVADFTRQELAIFVGTVFAVLSLSILAILNRMFGRYSETPETAAANANSSRSARDLVFEGVCWASAIAWLAILAIGW